mgnify:CR=1 FL=1|jgi:Malic enzyme
MKPPLRPLYPTLQSPAHAIPKPRHLIPTFPIALCGVPLLSSPRFNKGTAFPASERAEFGLHGRLPFRVASLDEQVERAYGQLQMRSEGNGGGEGKEAEALRKNTFLESLREQNWTLYYALVGRHLKELVPIIYTPTAVSCLIPFLPTSYSQADFDS